MNPRLHSILIGLLHAIGIFAFSIFLTFALPQTFLINSHAVTGAAVALMFVYPLTLLPKNKVDEAFSIIFWTLLFTSLIAVILWFAAGSLLESFVEYQKTMGL